MKSLFICLDKNTKNHVGESYDEILLVKNNVDSSNIQDYLPRIKDAIRLTNSLTKKDEESKEIKIILDAPPPFYWMCEQIQKSILLEEGIIIRIPQIPSEEDREFNEEEKNAFENYDRKK